MPTRTTRCFATVCLAALAGCAEDAPSAPLVPAVSPPRVLAASIDTNDVGSIVLNVQVDRPTAVAVSYWADEGDTIRVSSRTTALDERLLLPRLHPSTRYHYRVSPKGHVGQRGTGRDGVFVSSPMPAALAQTQFSVTGRATEPLLMVQLNGEFRGVAIIDRSGTPVWWWSTQGAPQGYARRANGNFVINDAGYGIFEVSPDGHVVHALEGVGHPDLAPFTHHEVLVTPANTVLFLAQDRRTVSDTTLTGDAIWEWSPEAGTVIRHMSVFDFLDPALDVGTHSTGTDWVHANSLAWGNHGNLILSLNWLNQVVSIAPKYAGLEWRLGGRGSTFAVASDAIFAGQHTAQQLSNGNVLMIDDGRDREEPERYSRALEVALDTMTRRARRAWSFSPEPSIYAPYVGSARRLANQNTVVHFGMVRGYSGASGPVATYEVNPRGEVVWRLGISALGGIGLSYRGEPIASVAAERGPP